jgi:hypothetical protein
MINSARQNQIVQFFLDRTELNIKELSFQALIDISSPLSLSTQKVLGRSSRGFTHRRRLHRHFL